MGGDSISAKNGEEEEVLLRRCTRYELGSPDSPGGALDILHLTPCGRWLRICSRVAYHQRSDAGHEQVSFLVNSATAARLFELYRGTVPVEVAETPTARDDAMSQGWEGLRDSIEAIAGHPIAEVHQNRGDELIEETIPRNSLLTRLKQWAKDWPPESGHSSPEGSGEVPFGDHSGLTPENLTSCQGNILRTLLKHNQRLVRNKLISQIEMFGYENSESDIGNQASAMVRMGLLDNSQKTVPKGYGLTAEGQRLARRLEPNVRTEN